MWIRRPSSLEHVDRSVDSTPCIGPILWCKGVRSKEYAVYILANGFLKCVEGFEVAVSVVEFELA